MKRQLVLTTTLLTLGLTATKAQNPQMGDYGYLYCHMHGNGRAWTAYALSRAHTGTVPLCADYLVTPNGTLQHYNPSTGEIRIVNTEMPKDANDKYKINDIKQYYGQK